MPLRSFISGALVVVQSATAAVQQPPATSARPPAAPAQSPPSGQSPARAKPAAPAGQSAAPLTLENAGQLALQQASAYQQALTDERIAALDVTQARAALLPKLRSTSTYTLNKPLTPHTNDPAFIAQNSVREHDSLAGAEGALAFGL